MIVKIGIFILATLWMLGATLKNDFGNIELIPMLLYFIIVLIASRKENK